MKALFKINKHYFQIAIDKAGLKRTELAKMVGVTPDWIYQLCLTGYGNGCSSSLKYKIETVLSHRGVSVYKSDIFYPAGKSSVF